jgi:hypothetical protein
MQSENSQAGAQRLLRLLLTIPLGLFGAAFALFGALVGTGIGGILLVIAFIYFGLAAGVLFAKHPITHTVCVVLGVIAVLLAAKLAISKAPW